MVFHFSKHTFGKRDPRLVIFYYQMTAAFSTSLSSWWHSAPPISLGYPERPLPKCPPIHKNPVPGGSEPCATKFSLGVSPVILWGISRYFRYFLKPPSHKAQDAGTPRNKNFD